MAVSVMAASAEALDEFHLLVRRCEPDAQSELLREGFLPGSAPNLIAAAVLCLEFVDVSSVVDPGPAAVRRLEAIIRSAASRIVVFRG